MKRTLLTLAVTSLLATTAFAGPIHTAAENGDLARVQKELDGGADVNAKEGAWGYTPLHQAAAEGHKEVAELLIANGADVNAKDDWGWTPLDLTTLRKQPETADLLREHGGKSGAEFSIHAAAGLGNIEAVKEHLAAGTDVNAKDSLGRTPLHSAAFDGHKEIAELLIANGADVNAKDVDEWTALHMAYTREVAELLIDNGADVNAMTDDGQTPLDVAVDEWFDEVADLLRKRGGKTGDWLSDWNKAEESIHIAVRVGHIEAVKQHIDAGADVNAKEGAWGYTPLHSAVEEGHKEVAELLIANGADVNVKADFFEITPLHSAAGYGHKEIAELLIAEGADVNAKMLNGRTPLDVVVDNPELADLLRKHDGKTGEELKALMPRLTYSRGLFDFSFNAINGMTYVVEVTQDFKQWGELETIEGTGKQVKFIDPRQPLVPFKRNFYRVKLVE